MSHSLLLESLAAAVLDGATVTFAPAQPTGEPGLPTAMTVGVRLDQRGQDHRNAVTVDLGELSLAESADVMLAGLLDDTLAPLIDLLLRDEVTGELLLDGVALRQEHSPA